MASNTMIPTTRTADGPMFRRRLGRSLLQVTEGSDKGKEARITGTCIGGGRSSVNELQLSDDSVSGTHFQLLLTEEGVLLRDLGSTNGTWIRRTRIREAWIEVGTIFHAGRCGIRLVSADEVDVPLSSSDHFDAMHGGSEIMRETFAALERVAGSPIDVLLIGETGTGKELASRGIHARSSRREGPFVVLDCGSLPRELAEAAILGYRKGAFTGAFEDTKGAFEEANGGTLFLDEIGDLPLALQPKLLRVLDRREVHRIGESKPRMVDVRVIAATHRNVRQMVGEGKFREDLYFRISGVVLELPPLRRRGDDVIALARSFVEQYAAEKGDSITLSDGAIDALRAHDWPGNVRELDKTIRRAVHFTPQSAIRAEDLSLGSRSARGEDELDALLSLTLDDAKQAFETIYLRRLFDECGGNVSETARRAKRSRPWLRELLKSYGIHGTE
ncbi:sigma 54-interacting transcriptional regulator [Paraliomyxa miuraensis]|uniref:sigma 54-interacting transcriptional regulator n=1 Tax=Paraliomyxa miuraensis TaxID=376150 RepID=UPI0022580BB9|nr:sigma 54-interacting transcriptional regulator [Paraliomyxa miuraensis]MCX4244389.1 sigma 54-dependent Fis family transcriptional regulator [Paraliomyxa miuraensis]